MRHLRLQLLERLVVDLTPAAVDIDLRGLEPCLALPDVADDVEGDDDW